MRRDVQVATLVGQQYAQGMPGTSATSERKSRTS